jgi:transposase-like protein
MRNTDATNIIAKWPSVSALADDLGIATVTVRAWRTRGIPAHRWTAIVRAAQARALRGVSLAALARAHEQKPDARRSAEDATP